MPSDLLVMLRNQRLNVASKMRELADHASDEGNRNFTGEEQNSWESLNAELDRYDARIKATMDGERRAKEAEAEFERLNGKPTDTEKRQDTEGREIPKGQVVAPQTTELRNFLQGKGERAYELPASRQVADIIEGRALTVGSLTAGGDLVPTDFYNRLVEHLIQVSAILQAKPTVLNTAAGEAIQIPKTTSHSTGALVAENSAITESDPVFGQVTLGAYKYGVLVPISRELIADSGVDLEGYLARECGRALGNAMGTHFILGTGTSQPTGVTTGATLGVTGGTGVVGVPTADNLIDMYYSVIPQYRNSPSCAWMMADTTVATVRKLKDTQNRYLWEPSLQLGVPDSFLGKPVITDYNVAATGLAAKSILFGDFSTYFIRFAGGARFERSDEYAFNTDMVTFRALMRADGNLVDRSGSVKYFQGGAS